jgi:two-component system phosphate regulon sensor histidine kinase PhoR
MLLSPRILALILAITITAVSLTFLSFVEGVNISMLFVAGASCFIFSFIFIFLTIDVLIFQEIKSITERIQQLQSNDFAVSENSIIKSANPIKKLNDDVFVYVAKKQKEIDELKRMEQFRREFLADVSHELKTPIFAAQGFVHTLIDGAIEDAKNRDRFLAKAAKSLDGLDALVRDLVVLSQIESGDLKMHIQAVDILSITHDVIEQLEEKAKKRGIKFKIKAKKKSEIKVMADPQRISQVMTNLIDNAIKYGKDAGLVTITFHEEKKNYEIAIEDDGLGIPPEHLSRIFERFYRIDKSRSRETGGTGLGLAIVKHIVGSHGSKIVVSSKLDAGTSFSFKLEKEDPNPYSSKLEALVDAG